MMGQRLHCDACGWTCESEKGMRLEDAHPDCPGASKTAPGGWTSTVLLAIEEHRSGKLSDAQLIGIIDDALPKCPSKNGSHGCMMRPGHRGSHRYWDAAEIPTWQNLTDYEAERPWGVFCEEEGWFLHSDGTPIGYESLVEARSVMSGLQLLLPARHYDARPLSGYIRCSVCGSSTGPWGRSCGPLKCLNGCGDPKALEVVSLDEALDPVWWSR